MIEGRKITKWTFSRWLTKRCSVRDLVRVCMSLDSNPYDSFWFVSQFFWVKFGENFKYLFRMHLIVELLSWIEIKDDLLTHQLIGMQFLKRWIDRNIWIYHISSFKWTRNIFLIWMNSKIKKLKDKHNQTKTDLDWDSKLNLTTKNIFLTLL